MSAETTDYKAIVRNALLDQDTFLKLTLTKKLRDDAAPWIKISARPVLLKGRRKIQFSYYTPRKHITKNYPLTSADEHLAQALALPFSQIHVQTTSGDIHIRITRKGKALISRGKQSRPAQEPILQHNRIKRHPLPVDAPDPFLHTIGVMTAQGKVKASMQPKFRQINQFLRVIQQTLPKNASADRPMDIIDCGCGSAYLTFAAYHFLNDVCGLSARVTGVDADREIIDKCRTLQHDLGWDGLDFRASAIADFDPTDSPDMVLSLHACDTATDEAIARGILWKSRVILAAPCCQHELRNQLQAPLFRPLLRHGVLEQRLSDLLTDAFRALLLRIMGYRTKVVEFISPEHTSKDLMIRAESGLKPGHPESVRQYQQLKAFWQVSPSIEEMLGHQLRRLLHTP